MTFIYSLSDPETNEIRYIGKSDNPKRRLADHMRSSKSGKTHRDRWINSLQSKPILNIIEEASEETWQDRERYWISQYKNLTNFTEGGEGLSPQKASEINRGRKLSKASRKKISESLKEHYKTAPKDHLGTYVRTQAHVENIRETTGKLTKFQVDEIRNSHKSKKMTQRELAYKYEVSQSCISKIVNNLAWKEDRNE